MQFHRDISIRQLDAHSLVHEYGESVLKRNTVPEYSQAKQWLYVQLAQLASIKLC